MSITSRVFLIIIVFFACDACVSSKHHPVKSQTGNNRVFPSNKNKNNN